MAVVINNNLLSALREHVLDISISGRYKIGDAWYDAEITDRFIAENLMVRVAFDVVPQDSQRTPATEFRLLDGSGQLLASEEKTVSFAQGTEGVSFWFVFNVKVGSDDP